MSGNSSVGTAGVYEAGDQRNVAEADKPTRDRNEEGVEHSHKGQDASKYLATTLSTSSALTHELCDRLAAQSKSSTFSRSNY